MPSDQTVSEDEASDEPGAGDTLNETESGSDNTEEPGDDVGNSGSTGG